MIYVKKQITLLLIGILSILLLLYLTYSFPPTYQFNTMFMNIPTFIPFFILVFSAFFGFTGYIFKSKFQGMLVGTFFIGYALLRYFHFTHWFFLLLFMILFILTELILVTSK